VSKLSTRICTNLYTVCLEVTTAMNLLKNGFPSTPSCGSSRSSWSKKHAARGANLDKSWQEEKEDGLPEQKQSDRGKVLPAVGACFCLAPQGTKALGRFGPRKDCLAVLAVLRLSVVGLLLLGDPFVPRGAAFAALCHVHCCLQYLNLNFLNPPLSN
jgi:hypothetical protein